MNRTIKFRAYLHENRTLGARMYYQDENTASSMKGLERFTQVVGLETGYTPEIMQFTGLKDKNGKEIYEGDIIKESKQGHPSVVEYYDGAFHGVHVHRDINGSENGKYEQVLGFLTEPVEIIGNIHESPELIK